MSRLLSLITVAVALTLGGVTSWGAPERAPRAQQQPPAPLIVQLITGAQDDDDDDAGQRQIVVQTVGSAEGDGSAERWAEGGEQAGAEGEGDGRASNLQLLVPVGVVDDGSQEQRGDDGLPRATDSWFSEQRGPAGASGGGAGSAGGASLVRLLQALLAADRGAPPRAHSAPLSLAPAPAPLADHHDRAQPTSVCPACLMLKALKMLQLQSSLKSLAGGQGGAGEARAVSAANGRGANCAVCVLELQHARRVSAARAGGSAGGGGGAGGGGWDAPAEGGDEDGVHIVA